MLIQGFMMSFWYDFTTTQSHLELRQATSHIIGQTLEMAVKLKQDFEAKRFILGLTSMLVNPNAQPVCQSIQSNFENIIKALVYLS